MITATGRWKLCGFGSSLTYQQGDPRVASPYFLKGSGGSSNSSTAPTARTEPDLRYMPPEVTDGGLNPPSTRFVSPAADAFSLAMTMYEAYRFNLGLQGVCDRNMFQPSIGISNNDINQHIMALEILPRLNYSFLPPGIDRLVVGLLQLNLQNRMCIADIVSNGYFMSGQQAIINTLETLHSRDIGTQSSQLLSMLHQRQLEVFPARMLKFTALPAIGKVCMANPMLWEYALPLHQLLAGVLGKDQYKPIAGPFIAAGLTNNTSAESMHAFLANLDFIHEIFDEFFFAVNVTSLLVNALEKANNPLLQNTAFEKLCSEGMSHAIRNANLTERLVPQLCKDACKHPDLNVKFQALYALSLLVGKIEKQYVVDNILPSLKYITETERNATMAMHVVGTYEAISDGVGPEYIASAVLPAVLPFLADRSVDRRSFETITSLVKTLLKKLCDPRTAELGMQPLSFGESDGRVITDPFAAAKGILANTKNSYKPRENVELTRITTAPPPLPSVPPPLPSMPAPGGGMDMLPPPPPVPGNNSGYQPAFAQYTSAYGNGGSIAPAPSIISESLAPPPIPPPIPPAPGAGALPLDSSSLKLFEAGGADGSSMSASNKAAADAKAKSSGGGWFSFKKKEEKVIVDEYQPPLIPLSPMNGSSAGASFSNNNTSNSLDVDDFMSSFVGGNNKPVAVAPVVQQKSAASMSAFSIAPPPAASSTFSSYTAPQQAQQPSALSIEQQLKETQAKIAQLSSGMAAPSVPLSQPAPMSTGGFAGYSQPYQQPMQQPQVSGAISGFSYGSGASASSNNSVSSGGGYDSSRIGLMPQASSNAYTPPSMPAAGSQLAGGYRPATYTNPAAQAPGAMPMYGGGGMPMQQQYQQQPPQQGYGMMPPQQQQQQHQGGMYGAPQAGMFGGMGVYPPQQQQTPQIMGMNNMGAMGMQQQQQQYPSQQNPGGGMMSSQQAQQQMQYQQQQQQRRGSNANNGSAFDFLS